MQNKIKAIIYLSVMYVTIISGCLANENDLNSYYYKKVSYIQPRDFALAEISPGINNYDKNDYLIRSARNYLNDSEFHKADYVLKYIDANKLSEKQSVQVHLIQAKIFLNSDVQQQTQAEIDMMNEPSDISEIINGSTNESHENVAAQLPVNQVPVQELTGEQIANEELRVEQLAAEQANPNFKAPVETATSISINHNFAATPNASDKSDNSLWQKLIVQDRSTLEALITKNQPQHQSSYDTVNDTLLGWLELAKLTKESNQNNNTDYFKKIQNWQNKFRQHPAKSYLAELQTDFTPLTYESSTPKKIVALLPLTGNLAPAAKAIKEGILTAYFNDNNIRKPEIFFIDTHNNSNEIATHYQKALSKNPDLIIGPLDKSSVQKLSSIHNRTTPIVALNYIADNLQQNNNYNFFQFGISAENEAVQAAIKTRQSGFNSSLVIVDDTDWGYRVSKAFEDKFESLNGMVTHVAFLNSKTDYKKLIYATLGLENSNLRKSTLKSVLGTDLAFQPRRRQDFDNIFLVTSSTEAKQVKPLLKFFYAGNIPIMATSNIIDYKNSTNNMHIKDLDGIKFCDIPLILQNNADNTELISTLRKTWPGNTDNLIRLYALGIDAYNLSYNLTKLTTLKNIGVSGNTGHLIVDNAGKINRQLPWAEISNNGFKITDVI